MTTRLITAFAASFALLTGCDSSTSSFPPPAPVCDPGSLCDVQTVPFVRVAVPNTNAWSPGQPPPAAGETTASVSQPEPGTICMSGRVEEGWAFLLLGFAAFDGTRFSDGLDASALGITRIEFVLDSPPPTGVWVQLASYQPDCTLGAAECQHWGFYLSEGDPSALFITNQPGLVSAPLSDFVRTESAAPTWDLDLSHLGTLQIGAGAFASISGDYDFCIHDLRFLNAEGVEVLPGG